MANKIQTYDSIDPNNCDVTAVSLVLRISDRQVRNLVKDGSLTPKTTTPKMLFDLSQAVQDYYEAKYGAGNEDSMAAAKYDQIRADARLKEAKAEKAEIELEEFKGIMHRSEDVEAVFNDMIFAVRDAILSMPGRLAMDVANLETAQECSGRIKQECNKVLDELSKYEYNPEKYAERVRERERMQEIEKEELRAEITAKPKRVRKSGTKKASKANQKGSG